MIYNATDYGITANSDISYKLNNLLAELASVDGDKTLEFEEGLYYLDSATCSSRLLYITNTIGDSEWKKGETPHLNTIGINLENIKNLTIDGKGARFIVRGQMTNMALSNCSNITIKNIAFETENPDLHELEVVNKSPFSVDFRLDSESRYINKNGKYYFVGNGFEVPFFDSYLNAHWIGKVNKKQKDRVQRVGHPLVGAYKIIEKEKGLFKVRYAFHKKFKLGDSFYLFDVRRKHVGIFVERCDAISLKDVKQHFNYSLALVCQDCKDFNMTGCAFVPKPDSAKLISSLADFIQICMCRGGINIKNNIFIGSGDDCINTHGIHFKINNIKNGNITVKFCHPQTHGFNPLRVGDTIRFINPSTLLGDKKAKILESKLLDEYTIELKVSSIEGAIEGHVIEDIDACPNLNFSNNTISRIITRGVLVTTSGKVIIDNNFFVDTYMSSILISDDAKSWYESGNVSDVTISNNTFLECGGYNVCVLPENGVNNQYVHDNIIIDSNIMSKKRGGIFIKCANNIKVKNNENLKRIKIKKSFVDIVKSQVEQEEVD